MRGQIELNMEGGGNIFNQLLSCLYSHYQKPQQ